MSLLKASSFVRRENGSVGREKGSGCGFKLRLTGEKGSGFKASIYIMARALSTFCSWRQLQESHDSPHSTADERWRRPGRRRSLRMGKATMWGLSSPLSVSIPSLISESTKDAEVVGVAERLGNGGLPVYEFEYKLDSTRGGMKRIFSTAFVASKKLYLLNIAYADRQENPIDGQTRSMLEQISEDFEEVPVQSRGFGILDVGYRSKDEAWAAGGSGILLRTTNGGKTWIRDKAADNIAANLYSVKFINDNKGFVLGGKKKGFKLRRTGEKGSGFKASSCVGQGRRAAASRLQASSDGRTATSDGRRVAAVASSFVGQGRTATACVRLGWDRGVRVFF